MFQEVLRTQLFQRAPAPDTKPDIPVKIRIPRVHIRSRIVPIHLDMNGALGISDCYDVGWLRSGPRPGEVGTALLIGHVDTEDGKPAIFFRLRELQLGDKILIRDATRAKRTFIITHIGTCAWNDPKHLQLLLRQTPVASVCLATCHGTWNEDIQEYSDRLIVRATTADEMGGRECKEFIEVLGSLGCPNG